MKKYLIVALVALSVITAFGFLIHQNKKLRRERDAYHNNTEVLLSEVERYQTKSGEQAVRVGELQLRVAYFPDPSLQRPLPAAHPAVIPLHFGSGPVLRRCWTDPPGPKDWSAESSLPAKLPAAPP